MRCLLIILLTVLPFITGKAQVSYGDNFLVDYNVKINLSTENDSTFLTLILTSERLKMSDSPKLLLRLMDDSVLSLDGYMLGSTNKSEGAVMIGNTAVAINHFITEAKFPITKDQIELRKCNVVVSRALNKKTVENVTLDNQVKKLEKEINRVNNSIIEHDAMGNLFRKQLEEIKKNNY